MAWDVFLSHASEDKPSLARPLAAALHYQGVRVWIDELQLDAGHALSRRIEDGIRTSRFGALLLTPRYFEKPWVRLELAQLIELRRDRLLPVLGPGMDLERVAAHSPTLENTKFLNVLHDDGVIRVERTIDGICELLVARLRRDPVASDISDCALVASIRARHWIRRRPTDLVRELADLYPSVITVSKIVQDASNLLATCSPTQKSLPLGYVNLMSGGEAAWHDVVTEGAKVGPRALAAILLCVRRQTDNWLENVEEMLQILIREDEG